MYIKNDITFTNNIIPQNINQTFIELQLVTIHLTSKEKLQIANIYIPPINSLNHTQIDEDHDITRCINYITSLPNTIIMGDINAHSTHWHSNTNDHRGNLIANIIQNSDHCILNTNTHTRFPFAKNQAPSSPDISAISSKLYNESKWATIQALSSDHIPISVTINTKRNTVAQKILHKLQKS